MNPTYGGPCQGVRNAIPELEKLGVFNEIVSLDDPSALFFGKGEFKMHLLGPAKGPWSYSAKLIPWLLENLCRFDAVIVDGLWRYPTYAVKNPQSFINGVGRISP